MYIDDFLWLPDIVDKLAVKHDVTPEEAEQVFFNGPHFVCKPANTALILSARDMDSSERKRYERR
jgi:uncharacterized protein